MTSSDNLFVNPRLAAADERITGISEELASIGRLILFGFLGF
jgi:hypothetical protein